MVELKNFFLNRNNMEFFAALYTLESKKERVFDLKKRYHISDFHSKVILSYLQKNGLVVYDWDRAKASYSIMFTPLGVRVRDMLLELRKLLIKKKIWDKG